MYTILFSRGVLFTVLDAFFEATLYRLTTFIFHRGIQSLTLLVIVYMFDTTGAWDPSFRFSGKRRLSFAGSLVTYTLFSIFLSSIIVLGVFNAGLSEKFSAQNVFSGGLFSAKAYIVYGIFGLLIILCLLVEAVGWIYPHLFMDIVKWRYQMRAAKLASGSTHSSLFLSLMRDTVNEFETASSRDRVRRTTIYALPVIVGLLSAYSSLMMDNFPPLPAIKDRMGLVFQGDVIMFDMKLVYLIYLAIVGVCSLVASSFQVCFGLFC